MSHVVTFGLPAIAFYESLPYAQDMREGFAEVFTVLQDGRDYVDILGPRMSFIYNLVLENRWYMKIVRHMIDSDSAMKNMVNRYAIVCIVRFLVNEKLWTLDDIESEQGQLTVELFEYCLERLPYIQSMIDAPKAQELAKAQIPSVERLVCPHILQLLKVAYPKIAAQGFKAKGYIRILKELFYRLAQGKFLEIQAAVGSIGLHVQIVDLMLCMLSGPSQLYQRGTDNASALAAQEEEIAAELCLLVPAKLEHLIPLLPRMMHAVVRALNGSTDRSVSVALKTLDVWVDSFNPEFIEKGMSAVLQPLMLALWSHLKPHPHPFGSKVAEMLGKMGGRSRRWLSEAVRVEYKPIPEYGLRVILAFPPRSNRDPSTSFLVPLDRCVQFAQEALDKSADSHRRRTSLRLLQICIATFVRLQLPKDMLPPKTATTLSDAAVPPGDRSSSPPEGSLEYAVARLQGILFSDAVEKPRIPIDANWPNELGIKTRKQQSAERAMLASLLTAVFSSGRQGDAELEAVNANKFAKAISRHFALLLAAGWANQEPLAIPPSSKLARYSAPDGNDKAAAAAAVATLKHLDPEVVMDAFEAGLSRHDINERNSVIECMCEFIDVLVQVGNVQKSTGSEAHFPGVDHPYASVLHELIVKAMHGCYGDSWPARFGGIQALLQIVNRVPKYLLEKPVTHIVRAVLCVLRCVPVHAAMQQEAIVGDLLSILETCLDAIDGDADNDNDVHMQKAHSDAVANDAAEADMEEDSPPGGSDKKGGVARGRKRSRGKEPGKVGGKRQAVSSRTDDDGEKSKETPTPVPLPPSAAASPPEAGQPPSALRSLTDAIVRDLFSSRSTDAVRDGAVRCLNAVAKHKHQTLADLLKEQMERLDPILSRRLLPLKASLTVHISYAQSLAYLIKTIPDALSMTTEVYRFIVDACYVAEEDDARLAASVSHRGGPVGMETVTRLKIACLEVLTAAVAWSAFQSLSPDSQKALLTPASSSQPVDLANKATTGAVETVSTGGQQEVAIESGDVAMASAEGTPESLSKIDIKPRLIGAFIAQLGSLDDRVVALANQGIRTCLDGGLLVKQVLQLSLRPILSDFAYCQKINLKLLNHLSRLLDLLASQFNVTIGERMTSHLKAWMDPETLLGAGPDNQVFWEPGTEWDIVAGMLDVYHKLLPRSAAVRFLETQEDRTGIVVLTIGLEEALRKLHMNPTMTRLWSPCRAPLTRFLCAYKKESVNYFLDVNGRLSNQEYFTRLLDIIRHPEGKELLDALAEESERMSSILALQAPANFDKSDPAAVELAHKVSGSIADSQMNVVHLIRAMVKLLPEWLPRSLFETLLKRWHTRCRRTFVPREKGGFRGHALEGKRLAKIIINYLERNHDETDGLFSLLEAFSSCTEPSREEEEEEASKRGVNHVNDGTDFTFVKTFYCTSVAERYDLSAKKAILRLWIDLFRSGSMHSETKINSLRLLINPLLTWALEKEQKELLDEEIVASMVKDILFAKLSAASATTNASQDDPTDVVVPMSGSAVEGEDEHVHSELAKMASLMVQIAQPLLHEHRREIIQYGWHTLKCDNISKPAGFLLLAYFFKNFPTPIRVMLQVYVALARPISTIDSSSRDVVRQAMDIILQILANAEATNALDNEIQLPRGGSEQMSAPGGAPSLNSPSSISTLGGITNSYTIYARYLKKVLSEEGHSRAAQSHIFQIIVRNRDMFYDSRALFLTIMYKSLTVLGIPTTATVEERLLSVDIAATLLYWDRKAEQEERKEAPADEEKEGKTSSLDVDAAAGPGAEGSMEDDEAANSAQGQNEAQDQNQQQQQTEQQPSRVNAAMDEAILNFLLRMVFMSCEVRDRDESGWRKLHAHSLEILKDFVRYRKPVPLRFSYYDKFLQQHLGQHHQAVQLATQEARPLPSEPPTALVTGLRVANILLEFQPDAWIRYSANQFAIMIEPTMSMGGRYKMPVDLLAGAVKKLFAAFPPQESAIIAKSDLNSHETFNTAHKVQLRVHEILNKFLMALADPNNALVPDLLGFNCAALAIFRGGMEGHPAAMKPIMGSFLKAMHRVARDHNSNPATQLLSSKSGQARMACTDADYGSGAWFMYHALHAAVPSALVLSGDHRRLFLSTLVLLITGPSVRSGQTDASILFAILELMRKWLLDPVHSHLTSKELLVLLQRIAQLERLHAIPPALKPAWDKIFLEVLYMVITKPSEKMTTPAHVLVPPAEQTAPGGPAAEERPVAAQPAGENQGAAPMPAEAAQQQQQQLPAVEQPPQAQLETPDFQTDVFLRVERTFCCGLQSSDPVTRQKFFRLYADRIPADLHDRLRYVIAIQDWDFLAHTYWLKHGVALLFDILHKADPVTLAYNSAHVPPLFNYKKSLAYLLAPIPTSTAPTAKKDTTTMLGGVDGMATTTTANTAKEGSGDTDAPMPPPPPPPPPAAAAVGPEKSGQGEGAEGRGHGEAAAAPPQQMEIDEVKPSQPQSTLPLVQPQEPEEDPVILVTDIDLPASLSQSLKEHVFFLQEQSMLRSASLVTCLVELVQSDPNVAHHLWVLLFPIVWTSLKKEQQTNLAKPIIQLLSKEHHTRQGHLRPTCGQTLLEGISMSQPQPKVPAEMIKYMGKHFHAWHIAISMLESHVGLFPRDMRCFDAVCDLYMSLGETDMAAGLWQRRAGLEETRTAVALHTHGYIPQAQAAFLELMSNSVTGTQQGQESPGEVTKSEMVLWHNKYLNCCEELNQWDIVFEYAKVTDHSALQLEAAARLHEWQHLKTVVLPKLQAEESAELSMVRAQLALREMQIVEVDKVCKQALMQCVHRWWQMPESSPCSYAPVLHAFQRAVELNESWRIVYEFTTNGGNTSSHYQELKDICDTWKLRTPNEWESVRWWSDILTWRNQMYNMTIQQFSNMQVAAPTLHQMGYRDKAWSVNRLAHVMRLHHLPEACMHAINTLYGFNAMEVQEAFVKVQEQGKSYLLQPHEHLHGLNLIHSTNMDYFQAPHQSEMINLKAQFLHVLGETEAAHSTFSQAVSLWSVNPDAWIAWGRFCDDMYTKSSAAAAQAAAAQAAAAQAASSLLMVPQPQPPPMPHHAPVEWLEFAATAYAQGIRIAANAEARNVIPRILQLLMLDQNGAAVVGKSLSELADQLPAWVWLPWLPQLLTSLQRPEITAARRLLAVVASQHTQTVYWHVRPATMALKEAAVRAVTDARKEAQVVAQQQQSQGQQEGGDEGTADQKRPASPHIEKPFEVMAYEAARELSELMRQKQPHQISMLESLNAELATKFNPRTDERLLAVIATLQYRTYKTNLVSTAPVPEAFKRELSSVCKACLGNSAPAAAAATPSTAPSQAAGNYQLQFAHDLDPESPDAPATLAELNEKLKGWRVMLEAMIEQQYPSRLRTEVEAHGLFEISLEEVELPLQPVWLPENSDPVYIERVGSIVEVVRRNYNSYRRFTLTGSDGKSRSYIISGAQTSTNSSEDRILAFLRNANVLLAAHPESRRRGLAFVAPGSTALWTSSGNMKLMEDDPTTFSYIDAYETHCARYGREPDAPIVVFKEHCTTDPGEGTISSDPEVRLQAYNEIVTKLVTENIFSQYMYKSLIENTQMLWAFKKQFAMSSAMSAVACHLLLIQGRTPSRLLVSKSTGRITQTEMATNFDARFQLERGQETVPFRLTRNMSTYIGPHGLEGTLVASATAAAQSLQADKSPAASLLALFLRDDVLTWFSKRTNSRSIAALHGSLRPHQLEACTNLNVRSALERAASMGPSSSVVAHGNPQAGFRALVECAIHPSNLSRMDPYWQPWL